MLKIASTRLLEHKSPPGRFNLKFSFKNDFLNLVLTVFIWSIRPTFSCLFNSLLFPSKRHSAIDECLGVFPNTWTPVFLHLFHYPLKPLWAITFLNFSFHLVKDKFKKSNADLLQMSPEPVDSSVHRSTVVVSSTSLSSLSRKLPPADRRCSASSFRRGPGWPRSRRDSAAGSAPSLGRMGPWGLKGSTFQIRYKCYEC